MARKKASDLLIEVESLKKENSELKALLKSNKKKSKTTNETVINEREILLELNDFLHELAYLPYNELFQFITSKIKSIFNVKAAIINTYDEVTSELILQCTTLTEKENADLIKLLGGKLLKRRTFVSEKNYERITSNVYEQVESIHELTFGAVPEITGKIVEKILGVDWFAALGLVHNEKLVGTMILAGDKNQSYPEREIILAFAGITASALVRKDAEEKLLDTEKRYQSIVNSSPMGMHMYELQEDDKLVLIDANPAANKILGFDHSSIIGLTIEEAFPSLVETEVPSRYRDVIKNKTVWKTEQINYKDEKIIGAFEVFAFCATEKQMVVRFLEISDRIQKEQKLKESQENFAITLRSIGDAVISTDKLGRITNMNPVAEEMCGWKLEHAQGKQLDEVFNIVDATTKFKLNNPVEKVINTGKVVELSNHTVLISRDGTERNISDSAAPIIDNKNNIQGVVLVFSDVTEAYNTRKALLESKEKLRVTAQLAKVGGWEIDVLGKTQYWTEETFRIYELESPVAPDLDRTIEYYHPDDQQKIRDNVEQAIENKRDFNFEARLITAKNNTIWVRVIGSLILHEGNLTRISGMIQDITERKIYEIALNNEKERISTILNLVGDPIFVKDDKHCFTLANKSFYEMVGLHEQNVIGKTLAEDISREEMDHFLKVDRLVLDSGIPDVREEKLTIDDKTKTIVTSKIRFTDNSGNRFLIGSIHDLTERVNAEKEKAHFNELMKFVISNTKSSISVHDTEMNYIYVSDRYYTDLHLSDKNIIGRNHYDVFPDLPQFLRDIHKRALNGETLSGENDPLVHKDGSIDWANWTCMPWYKADGTIGGIIIYIEVITERMKAAAAMKESEEKFRVLAENVPGVIYLCRNDERWSMVYLNDAIKTLTGYSKEEFLTDQISFADLYHPEDKEYVYNEVETALQNNVPFQIEYRILDKNKSCKWIQEHGVRLINENKVEFIEGFLSDITNRKLAEEKLRIRELRFEQLLQNSFDTIVLLDGDGIQRYVSASAERMHGYSPAELVDIPVIDLMIHPDDKAYVSSAFRKIIETGEGGAQYRHKRKEGGWIYLEARGTNQLDNPDIRGVVVNVRDITARKLAEEKLQESQALFTAFMDQIPGLVLIKDHELRPVFVNRTFREILPVDNWMGKLPEECFASELAADMRSHDEAAIASGFEQYEEAWPGLDGTLSTYETRKFRIDRAGTTPLLGALIIDITQRKRAEKALKESEELYRKLLTTVPDLIIHTDLQGNITFINEFVFPSLSYLPKETFLGKNMLSFISDEDLPRAVENTKLMFEHKLGPKEYRLKFEDETVLEAEVNGDVLFDANNNPTGMVYVIRNITERKQMEIDKQRMIDDLIAAKEKAEEMNKAKSNFFANMSHELRTPFVGIMGFAELLADSLENPDDKSMAEGILKASARMQDTLSKILGLARLESDAIEIKKKSFNVNELISDLYESFKGGALLKKISFEKRINFDELIIESDDIIIKDILQNFVSNAIKYTDQGGVEIIADIERNNSRDYLVIKVADTGIGIPKEKLKVIWEPFRQVSEGLNRSFDGTGLGLSIVKKSAELLQGSLSVESEEEHGSVFTFVLPINIINESISVIDHNDVIVNKSSASKKIIYIEDDEYSRNIVQRFLFGYYEIETATNANEAIEKVKTKLFDAVLMDINLKNKLNGIDLTQEIRKLDGYEGIPIIAITAYASKDDKSNFLASGLTHYIAKPFKKSELINLVNSVFTDDKK